MQNVFSMLLNYKVKHFCGYAPENDNNYKKSKRLIACLIAYLHFLDGIYSENH